MGTVIPFRKETSKKTAYHPPAPRLPKRQAKPVCFDRQEFSSLLALYSAEVAKGNWRDYAVDFLPGQALFSVYRHAHEAPIFTVSKQVQPSGKGREYLLFAGPRRLARRQTLAALSSDLRDAALHQR